MWGLLVLSQCGTFDIRHHNAGLRVTHRGLAISTEGNLKDLQSEFCTSGVEVRIEHSIKVNDGK